MLTHSSGTDTHRHAAAHAGAVTNAATIDASYGSTVFIRAQSRQHICIKLLTLSDAQSKVSCSSTGHSRIAFHQANALVLGSPRAYVM
jgi:hypothetical protein